jgi:hypothetical protein
MSHATINALMVGLKAFKNHSIDQGWVGCPGRRLMYVKVVPNAMAYVRTKNESN